MSSDILLYRRTVEQLSGRKLGLPPEQPRINVSQQRAAHLTSDIMALPVDASAYHSLQVINTASSDFGKFYFMPDYDPPNDPNHPVR